MNKADQIHQKHARITRPDLGEFARHEWALIGTPCSSLQHLAQIIIQRLSTDYRLAYVDADHQQADDPAEPLFGNSRLVYTDKIHFHRLDMQLKADTFRYRQWFQDQDMVLVNGNHFRAKRQIVVIDPRKYDSLQRKLDRLDQVDGFLLTAAEQEIPDFLQKHLPHWSDLPVWGPEALPQLIDFLRNRLQAAVPPVSGLVLAGGRSQRMGRDKSLLQYHGKAQHEHLYELLRQQDIPSWISCRAEQVEKMPAEAAVLPDSFVGLGPFGALLSAFRHDPNCAWLVIACDLPFVDAAAIEHLVTHRRISAVATAFYNAETDFPDPLLTLWEPRAYPILLQFLAQGYSCPRKVLINSDTEVIQPSQPYWLMNVNTPEEYRMAFQQLTTHSVSKR